MLKDLKIGAKFFLSLTLISTIPLAVISISNYYYSKNQIQKNTIGNLLAINNSRADHVNDIIQLRQEQAKELAGSYVARQLKADGINEPEKIRTIQAHIESIFGELKAEPISDYKIIDQESTVENISVWDIYGKIVANTNKALIGKRMPDTILHILYEKGAYFVGFDKDELTGEDFLTILEEIRNWKTDEYSGVVFLKFSARVLNDITTERKGLGNTAETYIVDKKLRMITDSRFIKDAILNVRVDTAATQACFKRSKSPAIYKDYQGRTVFGVQRYLQDQQWCLITEIDVEEAFEPMIAFRNRTFIIVGCLIFFILIFVNFAGKMFIRPIKNLHDASLQVARGNYDVEVAMNQRDEFGELATAFDQMTKVLASTTAKLKEQNKILEKQKDELKRFDELKSEFVSTVSHELRTPMTIIKDSIMQLMEEVEEMPKDEKDMLLSMALNNINRLANLINNLLDLSKIEAGKIELQKEFINMVNLAKEVCYGFETQAKKKGIEVRCRSAKNEINVYADRDKITQVFINLIGNSMKFVEKGHVEVSVAEDDERVVCAVKDSGPGISKDDLQKVFSKFQQFGRKPGSGAKGTGLGLSICKGLVDLHKGDIWVESELGKGTQFIFTIPKETHSLPEPEEA